MGTLQKRNLYASMNSYMNIPELRHFLGWDRPAIELVAKRLYSYLTSEDKEIANLYRRATIVVPTSGSGRKLREYIAEHAKSKTGKPILMPKITLAGQLLTCKDSNTATEDETLAAWLQVLCADDADPVAQYAPLIPRRPENNIERWAVAVAHKLIALRARLEQEEVTPDQVSGLLKHREEHVLKQINDLSEHNGTERTNLKARRAVLSHEQVRWSKLAEIFTKVDTLLEQNYHKQSREQEREIIVNTPLPIKQSKLLIFACVPEFSPQVERYLKALQHNHRCEVQVWVHAPDTPEYKERFDSVGRPIEKHWSNCDVDIPRALVFCETDSEQIDNTKSTIHLVNDAVELAEEAVRLASGLTSEQVEIATGDAAYTPALIEAFKNPPSGDGWQLRDPEGRSILITDVGRLPEQLANYCAAHHTNRLHDTATGGQGELNAYVELLCNQALQQALGAQAEISLQLQRHVEQLREALLPASVDLLCHYLDPKTELPTADYRNLEYIAKDRSRIFHEYAEEVKDFANACCDINTLPEALTKLATSLTKLYKDTPLNKAVEQLCAKIKGKESMQLFHLVPHADTVLEILRYRIQTAIKGISESQESVGDVQGWRELAFSRASTFIIAAMHDGCIPEPVQEDEFLPESLCQELNIRHEPFRIARDAYLLTSLLQSHELGRVHFILTRQNPDGTAVAPSSLLLRCGQELPQRARTLFAESSKVSAMPTVPLCPLKHAQIATETKDGVSPGFFECISAIAPGTTNPFSKSSKTYSPTLLSGFLQCPLTFWLKHLFDIDAGCVYDEEKAELENNEYGTIMHAVLEKVVQQIPSEEKLRELSPQAASKEQLIASVEELAQQELYKEWEKVYNPKQQGTVQSLPMELQLRNIEKSLHVFAGVHVRDLLAGWQNVACELSLRPTLTLSNGQKVEFRMTADRIDRNKNGHWRIIDYKTSSQVKKPFKQHLEEMEDGEDSPFSRFMNTEEYPFPLIRAEFEMDETTITRFYRWQDVQLMLYAYGLRQLNAKNIREDLEDESLADVMPDLLYYNIQTKTQQLECFPFVENRCMTPTAGRAKGRFIDTTEQILQNAMTTVDSAIRMIKDGVCLFSAESLKLKNRPFSKLTDETWDKNAPRFGAISAQCDPRSMFELPALNI